MDKKLQNKVWSLLPKEFKEEVKDCYKTAKAQHKENFHLEVEAALIRERIIMLEYFFGFHNLTSDSEGEDEMLCVSRKQIDALQSEIFKAIMDAHDADDWQDAAHYILDVMPRSFTALFGRHNLTSDEEGEEMLTCEKYKVEEALNYCDELDSISGSHNMLNWGKQMIVYLFGAKCLPDKEQPPKKERL